MWRDLVDAQALAPLGADLYPRVFLAPDGGYLKLAIPRTGGLTLPVPANGSRVRRASFRKLEPTRISMDGDDFMEATTIADSP